MNSKKYYVGYKFELRGDGGLPDYSFSENLTGARDHISKDAKLFNKRLVFDEMIFAFMRENDDFKNSFVRSCLNINNKEAWSFKREFLDSVILTKNIKCDLEENDLDSCADSSCKCAKSKYSFSTMSVPTMKRFLVDGFEYPFDHGVLQRIDLIPKFLGKGFHRFFTRPRDKDR
ncbi:hypothetical protein C2G38_2045652 [Gigaspora rosea]|uniref:Uncharacterized protein n=1 Tax=Gigaspora rosea TaxID=44941 RepID=A0A397UCH0_9GLOM|nr:hypothetical protein C2G38_2045652 [Gigaspora rosea]